MISRERGINFENNKDREPMANPIEDEEEIPTFIEKTEYEKAHLSSQLFERLSSLMGIETKGGIQK
jgi:hypothetical protein